MTKGKSLPDGWVWTTLGKVTLPINKVSPRSNPNESFIYLDISSIDNKVHKIIEPKEYMGGEAPSRARQLVRANDVLFSTVRTYLENVALVPDMYDGQIASTGFSVLRASEVVHPKFLFYYTLTHSFLEPLNELQRGTSYPAVRDGDVRVQPFPLPPLPEQERIVAKIEELFTQLDAGVAALERVRAGLKRYKASVLKAACEGRLVEQDPDDEPAEEMIKRISKTLPVKEKLPSVPDGWCWAKIEQVVSSEPGSIRSGPFGSHLHHSEFQDTGILAIGIDNVLEGAFSLGKQHRISTEKYEQLKKFTAHPLDVLVTVMATVGRCCVIPSDLETAIITKHVYRLSVEKGIINPYYLMYNFLAASNVRNQIFEQVRGQTRPGINGSILRNIYVPIAPLNEQNRIIAEIEQRLSVAIKIESAICLAIKRSERLRQSMLKKAFMGNIL